MPNVPKARQVAEVQAVVKTNRLRNWKMDGEQIEHQDYFWTQNLKSVEEGIIPNL